MRQIFNQVHQNQLRARREIGLQMAAIHEHLVWTSTLLSYRITLVWCEKLFWPSREEQTWIGAPIKWQLIYEDDCIVDCLLWKMRSENEMFSFFHNHQFHGRVGFQKLAEQISRLQSSICIEPFKSCDDRRIFVLQKHRPCFLSIRIIAGAFVYLYMPYLVSQMGLEASISTILHTRTPFGWNLLAAALNLFCMWPHVAELVVPWTLQLDEEAYIWRNFAVWVSKLIYKSREKHCFLFWLVLQQCKNGPHCLHFHETQIVFAGFL